jgi:Xaa-Pro aminopeptidase
MPWGASERPVQQGELLFVDLGVGQGGYYGDHARTYSIGEPSPMAERFDAAILAIDAAVTSELRPGVMACDLWSAGLEAAHAHGVEQWFQGYRSPFGKYLGHGLGIEIDEPPFITASARTKLREGMVLAIEPKLIHPEEGGMGHEDLFVITADGAKRLSPAPIGLQVLATA